MFKLIMRLLEFMDSCLMCLGGWRGLIVAVSLIAVLKPSAPLSLLPEVGSVRLSSCY